MRGNWGAVAPTHAQFLPHESGDLAEPFVVEPGAANGVGDEFRISVPASEVWASLGAGHAQSPRDCWSRFRVLALMRNRKARKSPHRSDGPMGVHHAS